MAQDADIELCLLDLSLKNEQGFGAIQCIKETAPRVAIIMVSGSDDSATIRCCIDAGAMSFVPKGVAPEVLTHALQRVLAGADNLRRTSREHTGDCPAQGQPVPTPAAGAAGL